MKRSTHCGFTAAAFALFGVLLLASPCLAQEDLADPETAVEAGRAALGSSWGTPWYDSKTDDFRPVNLRRPRQPSKFWRWLGNLFRGVNWDVGGVLRFLAWLLLALLLVWGAVALVRAMQAAELRQAAEAADAELARAEIERVEALPVAIAQSVDGFLEEARRRYEAGDLSGAIVYLFSHQLIELDRRGLLRLVKGTTNRQYLRQVRLSATHAPPVPEILRRTTQLFEASFFGAHAPPRADFERCLRETTELESLLSQPEEAAA